MKFWWVNQGKTFHKEIRAGYLWSPKVDANGAFNYSYQTMTLVEPGDVIFSYADSQIKAVGIAQRRSYLGPKPDFGNQGANWSQIGWYVDVEFQVLLEAPRPKDFIDELRPFLPEKYSPILATGKGNQKLYLVDISEEVAFILMRHAGVALDMIAARLSPLSHSASEYEIGFEIASRGVGGNFEQEQIVMARRGQGVFRHNVRLVENKCRLTGIEDSRHLIASHIKPWRDSHDDEKISGNNGLFLSPHVDHLFDAGMISFQDCGELLISECLDQRVLDSWNLPRKLSSSPLNSEQRYFMDYHRKHVLQV
jgi:hypothetical protein